MAKIKITEQQARLLGLKSNLKVKITKEQYNRIFASGLINENNEVKGGLSRVDKAFKKEFAGNDVKNLKETDFNIQKPNPSLGKTAQGKFNKPVTEMGDSIKNEVQNLIKYMYRKDENFSPFWTQNGLTYEDICNNLMDKKMVVSENGKFTISKALGEPQKAIEMIENTLREMIGSENLTELDNYPAGAETDPRAPFNQREPEVSKPIEPSQHNFKLVGMGREIALFKGQDGLYVFYHDNLGENELNNYSEREKYFIGKDEVGDAEYEYGDFEKSPEAIENYVNDNLQSLSIGDGMNSYEEGSDLVKLDDDLKNYILSLYDKDKQIIKVLGSVSENIETPEEKMSRLNTAIAAKRAESERLESDRQSRLDRQNAIDSARAEEKLRMQKQMSANEPEAPKGPETFFGRDWETVEETTGAASSGAFTAPMGASVVKRELPITENIPSNYTHYAVRKSDNKIVNGWDYSNLYDSETRGYDNASIKEYSKGDLIDMFPESKLAEFKIVTTKFLKNSGMDPSDTNNWFKYDSLNETTSTTSAGNFQYDANALPGINRDGSFKNTKKTKAETKTQWAGGEFVDFNDCTKLNNKPAGAGCSQGAPDKVVKYKKTKGNINAPSLSEAKSIKK